MNIGSVIFTQGSFTHSSEQIVQTSPAYMPFQNVFGQMVEHFLGNNQSNEELISLVDVKQKLEAILPILFEKTEEELVELLGNEITKIIYPVLEQLQQLIDQNGMEVAETEKLSNYISMLFAPANSIIDMPMHQTEVNQSMNRETVASFYRFLNVIETVVTQLTAQKNSHHNQTLNEQPLQLQKYENVVSKIVEQLKTNLQNNQSAFAKNSFTEGKENQAKPVYFQQQFIPFQQMSMDRIQQLEWRIQLIDETDSATFAKEFEKILMNSNLRTFKNGLTELHVRLYPEHLGRLSIKIIQQDGTLVTKITTQTEAAKNLIESQMHQLRHALVAQNIQIEKIEITTSANVQQEQNQSGAQEREKHEREPSQFAREEEHREGEEQSFKEWLESLIL